MTGCRSEATQASEESISTGSLNSKSLILLHSFQFYIAVTVIFTVCTNIHCLQHVDFDQIRYHLSSISIPLILPNLLKLAFMLWPLSLSPDLHILSDCGLNRVLTFAPLTMAKCWYFLSMTMAITHMLPNLFGTFVV